MKSTICLVEFFVQYRVVDQIRSRITAPETFLSLMDLRCFV